MNSVTNVLFGGLGGQGVVTASDILADAVFTAGFDVKKSDIHGMAQRGGSVSSDVRFGQRVLSPMIPAGEVDYLVVLDESRIDDFRHRLRAEGVIISPGDLGCVELENKKAINVALLALLTVRLGLPVACVEAAICRRLKQSVHDVSLRTFSRLARASVECFERAMDTSP